MKAILAALVLCHAFSGGFCAESLPGTGALEPAPEPDTSREMVEGIGRWLERATSLAAVERGSRWLAAAESPGWAAFAQGRRDALRKMLGATDARAGGVIDEIHQLGAEAAVPLPGGITMTNVRWPAWPGVNGEGVLFRPATKPRGITVALCDADEAPEESALTRRLAAEGWLVIAPVLLNRRDDWSGSELLQRYTNQPHREWIYRQAFELGRTILGYEAQKVFALLDAVTAQDFPDRVAAGHLALQGYGEGGLLALLCGALDERIESVGVSGYFGPRDKLYREPIYRNVFGLLRDSGDAQLAALIAPRQLSIEYSDVPPVTGPPPPDARRMGAAPGALSRPSWKEVTAEVGDANELRRRLHSPPVVLSRALGVSCADLPVQPAKAEAASAATQHFRTARQKRTFRELEAYTQSLVEVAEEARNKAARLASAPGVSREAIQNLRREELWRDVIGEIDTPPLPANPRSRLVMEGEHWRAFEVKLDVFEDVFAWGWLLLPRDLQLGERRPVVVCQHGLEGLPEDVVNSDPTAPAFAYYKAFAARLADEGFIVYAPHNPYRGGDRFRVLQRQANPLGLSLFSFILAQHQAILRWLGSRPEVDSARIAFYGLSYGGKSAMRIPALLDGYCLSICSGDFNEWVRKTVGINFPASYLVTGEYEMPEWNLANVASYAEMALLVAPRPFMVERGHQDGVARDEWVAYEYAKVRRGYAELGVAERTEIEWFDGPHTIHGAGTFEFLRRHLSWRGPAKQ